MTDNTFAKSSRTQNDAMKQNRMNKVDEIKKS
jgi:hypothetical protein